MGFEEAGRDLAGLLLEIGVVGGRPHSDLLIAQRWIEGSEGNHDNYNTYLDKEGRALITFTSRKLRQWPLLTGDGSLYEESRADDATDLANQLFGALEVRGLAEVEFKRDSSSGELVIIEPTVGRVSGRCGLVEGGCVELRYTMYCDLTGRPLPAERTQRYVGVKWMFIRRDLLAVLQHCSREKSVPRALLTSLRGPKVYALFSWSDPMPP